MPSPSGIGLSIMLGDMGMSLKDGGGHMVVGSFHLGWGLAERVRPIPIRRGWDPIRMSSSISRPQ